MAAKRACWSTGLAMGVALAVASCAKAPGPTHESNDKPLPPTAVTAAVGENHLVVTWRPPVSEGLVPVDGWVVRVNGTAATFDAGTRLVTLPTPASGVAEVTVASKNTAGESPEARAEGSGARVCVAATPELPLVGGTDVVSTAALDVDGDGLEDVARLSPGFVNVYRGTGLGNFEWVARYATAATAGVLVSGTFGVGLGRQAFALWDRSNGGLLFPADFDTRGASLRVVIPKSPATVSAKVIDVEGDGRDEIAVYSSTEAGVSLVHRDERGTISVDALPVQSLKVLNLWAVDYDGDGARELMLLTPENTVAVFKGSGGGFASTAQVMTIAPNVSVFVEDLDGNGTSELVLASRPDDKTLTLEMRSGVPGAAVQTATITPGFADVAPRVLGVFDVTNDARAEILLIDEFEQRVRAVHLLPSGETEEVASARVFGRPSSAVPSNVVGATRKRLWVSREDLPWPALLSLTETDPHAASTVSRAPEHLTVADFDGDGKPDVALVASGSDGGVMRLGNGARRFGPEILMTFPGAPRLVRAAQGSGARAVLTAAAGATTIELTLQRYTSGSVTAGESVSVPGELFDAVAADFDGDGATDVAVSSRSRVLVYFGASGAWGSAPLEVLNAPARLGASNVDGMTGEELLMSASDGVVVTRFKSKAAERLAVFPTRQRPGRAVAADLDGDGAVEVVFGEGQTLLFGKRDGSAWKMSALEMPAEVGDVEALRWDGDALLDIVAFVPGSHHSVALQREKNVFVHAGTWPLNQRVEVAFGDFDSDGRAELLTGTSVGTRGLGTAERLTIFQQACGL